MTTEPQYAGFWVRLGAMLVDLVIVLPIALIALWGEHYYRLFEIYWLIPTILLSVFYSVWLVLRFGGTPGKRALGLRIRNIDGTPITARAATIRQLPELILWTIGQVALCSPLLSMSDADYAALTLPHAHRVQFLRAHAPQWYRPVDMAYQMWVWGELIVLLTNRKRRALHDFLAGTVVTKE